MPIIWRQMLGFQLFSPFCHAFCWRADCRMTITCVGVYPLKIIVKLHPGQMHAPIPVNGGRKPLGTVKKSYCKVKFVGNSGVLISDGCAATSTKTTLNAKRFGKGFEFTRKELKLRWPITNPYSEWAANRLPAIVIVVEINPERLSLKFRFDISAKTRAGFDTFTHGPTSVFQSISNRHYARAELSEHGEFNVVIPGVYTAKSTAITAKAPNKIMEQVMPLERSPFCFMCRIISTPPERNWIIQNVLKRSRDYLG